MVESHVKNNDNSQIISKRADRSQSKNYNSNNYANNTKTQSKEDIAKKSSIKFKSNGVFVTHVWWLDALLFIGGTLLLGGLATLLGGKMFNFQNYQMPPGTVPKIVFPIAWAIIYIAIGVSTFLMWRDKDIKSDGRKVNLIIYFVHMFFNILWPLIFFRLDMPIFAVIWLILTVISAFVVMYRYFITNIPSGIIFMIYSVWLMYALYLNLGLALINF